MKVKNAAAKIVSVALSTMVFATLWGWIAADGSHGKQAVADQAAIGSSGSATSAAAPTPEANVRRMVIIRRVNPDGTVTQYIVPESELQAATGKSLSSSSSRSSTKASRPMTRSRGS